MFASIRWQARPRWAACQLGVFRISVSTCQPAARRAGHGRQLACYLRARRPLASTGLRVGKWSCGLNSRQINHLENTAQVKHIIGGKPPPHRAAAIVHPAAARTVSAAPVPAARLITVDAESAGQRLDNFLMRRLKGVPKTHVYRIIRSGEVRINKGRASADTRVQDGDLVRLPPVRVSDKIAEKTERPAPAREFPVLLEDEYLIAIDKPAGVAVHGGSGVSFGVIEQLRQARPQAKFLELVHRLDRETSGILLLAKKRSALTHLQDQFRERETGKTYLALVTGTWPANKKVIDTPLHKYLQADGERRVRVTTADDPDGMRSITLVKVRASAAARPQQGLPAMTLLEVTIKTGRTHQIRVHLASQGHPIAGDEKYGDFDLNKLLHKSGLKRMFLHAWRLQFNHPASGTRTELLAGLPPELAAFAPAP
jgi:23S rRNA pseudouridine955/2504/2580 synthase